jgi:prepilin-type processing-associated H-X9-DG protein
LEDSGLIVEAACAAWHGTVYGLGQIGYRHAGQCNALYVDGHAGIAPEDAKKSTNSVYLGNYFGTIPTSPVEHHRLMLAVIDNKFYSHKSYQGGFNEKIFCGDFFLFYFLFIIKQCS